MTRFSILQILFENHYHEQFAHRRLALFSHNGFHTRWVLIIYILPRYILPSCFWNSNSHDYHGDSLIVMFPRFSNCFLQFSLVFPHVFPDVSTVSSAFLQFPGSVPPVSYFRFYFFLDIVYDFNFSAAEYNFV